MKLSISFKLVTMTLAILVLTAIPITHKSVGIFEDSARRTAEEQNLTTATNKAQEVETLLISYIDKAKTLASFVLTARDPAAGIAADDQTERAIDAVFGLSSDLMAVEIYEVAGGAPVFLRREAREEKFRRFGVDSSYVDKVKKGLGIPLALVAQGEFLVENATLEKDKPLLVLGAPLAKGADGRTANFVLLFVDLHKVQSVFSSMSRRRTFAVDRKGRLICHSYDPFTLDRLDFSNHPAVEKAAGSSTPRKQVRYLHPDVNEVYLSAFSKSALGMTFVSEVEEKVVLAPVLQVRRQAVYITGVMLSTMVLVVFFFSMTLTSPIEKLVFIAGRIGKGDFGISARDKVRSRDEVGTLAVAIDEMVGGLKERDKVKTLFSKFHGSSVADDLIQGEVGMRGESKNVTVFFSDIRGFTAFSEGRTPEEVVAMLNEYFAVMVAIINRNHGVVDKFIGDAIMAVWGAPKSTGEDSYWATKACLEMREGLDRLNASRMERGLGPIMIGMGVHSGVAISGTIGSEERMEYTVIGDTVNQTSRIEAATKAFGTDLLLSDATAEAVKDRFVLETAGTAVVKGKTEPLKLYKVRGRIGADGQKVIVATPWSDYEAEAADKVKVG